MNIDKLSEAIGMIDDNMIKEAKETTKKAVVFPFRKLAAVAAIALVCFGSVPALAAADVEPAYNLLYSISPALAQKLKPVNLSCVDQGIQVEVDSAYIHGDTAEAIICIKDLTGERIDETVDLFDSYNIRNMKDSSGICNLLDYNENTGIAAFAVRIEQMDGSSLSGSKVTVSLSKLLCKKGTFNGVLEDITLSSVTDTPHLTDNVKIRGGGGAPRPDDAVFLQPASTPLLTPLPGISVTGLGYENGKLHVQICYEDIGNTDNHGWIRLQSKGGEVLDSSYDISFWDSSLTDSYDEYIFELPYEELKNYKIYAEFVNSGLLIEGDWEITFPMEQVK